MSQPHRVSDLLVTQNGSFVRAKAIHPRYNIEEYKNTSDAAWKQIVGDFYAWSAEWSCPRTNERDVILVQPFDVPAVVLLKSGN